MLGNYAQLSVIMVYEFEKMCLCQQVEWKHKKSIKKY